MKNLGKIGLAAGLATAVILLIRKRKDGTRLLDDVTHQVTQWANTLMSVKNKLNTPASGTYANGQAPKTSSTGKAARPTGNHQE